MIVPRPLTLLASAYAVAIFGFIFLPVIVLALFSLQASSLPIPLSPGLPCAGIWRSSMIHGS